MDIAIVETGNGGDVVIKGNDLLLALKGENNPYLAMFGGNVDQVTGTREEGEEAFDYWANTLFYENEPEIQLNSRTEKALKEIYLDSSGRVLIENAIKEDLSFMGSFAEITVTTAITATDRLEALITWIGLDGIERAVNLVFQASDDGDFYLFDFNNDFLV